MSFRPLRALLTATFLAAPMVAHGQRTTAPMKVRLAEREVALDGFGIGKGQADAPIWIVELADFGCGYCAKFAAETMPRLDSLYTRTGKARWRYVPFVLGMFPNAREAAEGSICADEQGKFWPMHDKLYQQRKVWMQASNARQTVARLAKEAGVEPIAFDICISGPRVGQTLAKNNALARSLFVRGTPTFVINGEIVPGALPADIFVRGLDAVYRNATSGR